MQTDISEHRIYAAPELAFDSTELPAKDEIMPIFAQWLAQKLGEPVYRDEHRTVWFGKAIDEKHELFAPFRLEIEQEWGIGNLMHHAGDMEFIAQAIQNDVLGQQFQDGSQMILSAAPPEGMIFMS